MPAILMDAYRPKIAIDLDGVIWDLVRPWILFYNQVYNDTVLYDNILQYNLSESCTKATKDELSEIIKDSAFWEHVVPFEYSFKYLKRLNTEFELYIATATDYEIAHAKINRFLSLFPFINRKQIIFIYNKGLLNVDWLIDDCIENLVSGNFNKIVLDAPYNRNCTEDFIRAKNLKDVYNILIDYYKE